MPFRYDEPSRVWAIRLLGRFEAFFGGELYHIPRRAQRLIALLALESATPRAVLAGTLWPDSTERQALANLRATVVEVRTAAPGLLDDTREPLRLAANTIVDVHELFAHDAQLGPWPNAALVARRLVNVGSLLPGWYENWVLDHQEHVRQVSVRVFMRLAEQLLADGDHSMALRVAHRVTSLEPLRESGHRLVARIYLASGDPVMALKTYKDFRAASLKEVGLAPTEKFEHLVRPLLEERRDRRLQATGRHIRSAPTA